MIDKYTGQEIVSPLDTLSAWPLIYEKLAESEKRATLNQLVMCRDSQLPETPQSGAHEDSDPQQPLNDLLNQWGSAIVISYCESPNGSTVTRPSPNLPQLSETPPASA